MGINNGKKNIKMRDNKLIAEFMGIEEAYNPNGNDWVLKKTIPDVNGDTDILESCKGNELTYQAIIEFINQNN